MTFELSQILIGLLGLTIVVSIHEFGHLLAAKFFKIQVQVFSVGWGPKLFGWSWNGTEYRVSMVPLGGYCRMKGEEDMQSALVNKKDYLDASPGSFYSAKPYQRMIVSFAGPFFNLVTAILLFAFMSTSPVAYVAGVPRIALSKDYADFVRTLSDVNPKLITEESPAFKAGLKTGDLVRSIDGKEIWTFGELASAISGKAGGELTLGVQRETGLVSLVVRPELDTVQGSVNIGVLNLLEPVILKVRGNAATAGLLPGDRIIAVNGIPCTWNVDVDQAVLGAKGPVQIKILRAGSEMDIQVFPDLEKDIPRLDISWDGIHIHQEGKTLLEALPAGFGQTFGILGSIVDSFKFFSMGLDPSLAVSGPLRSISMIGTPVSKAMETDIWSALGMFSRILAVFSIALFFGNLLPIPVLDGGQIVLGIVESIRRKPLKVRTIQRYNMIGMLLILPILALALFGDFKLFF